MATLEQIQNRMKKLQAQADALIAKNAQVVVDQIRELIGCASNLALQRLSQKPSGPYNTAWNETAGNHDEHGAQSTFAR